MPALAPGPGFPNCTMLIGWCPATKARASSSRESTAPAVSCPLASAGTEICGAFSSAAPAVFRSARSVLSLAWYAAAPLGAITRTVTRDGPEPKDARTAGAQALARLLPNRLRTAGVSTTTAELTGTSEVDPSASSPREGKPCALSAAHIAGSQETLTSGLTCWATQVAAAARAAAAWCTAAALGGRAAGERPKYLTPATASTPMTTTTATSRATRRALGRPADGAGPAEAGPATGAFLADGGLPWGGSLTSDGALAVVPSHSVSSSSANGPAFAARVG